jgi:tetratricopeptide (TPR) repeat protein
MTVKRGYILWFLGGLFCFSSCASQRMAASAEEYFSIGMAYFELGKYAEAEQWLNRAKIADKTRTASQYNLGRIAFETGRYGEAVKIFDKILKADPDNVMTLKAAAYTRIKMGELAEAEALYGRVLRLVPESADDGYNYALVLYALEKPGQAEAVLTKYHFALAENDDSLLLLARARAKQDKVEAADSYSQWLANNSDPLVRYEYAQVLEKAELYARALEEYREILGTLSQDNVKLTRPTVRYALARLLLFADPENDEGITELRTAVSEGFSDTDKIRALLDHPEISDAHKADIRRLLDEGVPAPESEADVEGGTDGSQE